jgi:hypothetical protein
MDQAALDFYATPAPLTEVKCHADLLAAMPDDVERIALAIPGVLIHEYWAERYGVQLTDAGRAPGHLRPMEQLLEAVHDLDPRPLMAAREPSRRAVVVCRSFALLLTAALRAKRIPARARCGFGAYLYAGRFVDHWVCEYWNAAQARWVMVDPQLDELQRDALRIDFSPLDLPPGRFLVAGEAWARCRAGELDPAHFGIAELWGRWFIAGNLIRDLAALNKQELLAWDVWGAAPSPEHALGTDELAWFDRLAAISRAPDPNAVRDLLRSDERVRVPAQVLNARRQRLEPVSA